MVSIEKIRNIAIIAHVDHGKTTLVDRILQCVSSERESEKLQTRAMDSNELERERGITILSKNTSIFYKDYKINIVDTPGHADFGGEVERVLNMVDSVLLLVDAFEGPMPQTKYVLKKAMQMKLFPIVVINKIDRENANVDQTIDKIYDLFIDLNANEEQLEFPVVYCSAKEGYALKEVDGTKESISMILDMIVDIVSPPQAFLEKTLQIQISTLDYDNYVGVIATGRIRQGKMVLNQMVEADYGGDKHKFKITKLIGYNGLKRVDIDEGVAGDIISFAGSNKIKVGSTVGIVDSVDPLPLIKVDEPTISMRFLVNDSPFAGTEGKYLTSRHIKDRLEKEALSNVALRVEQTDTTEAFKVSGRGELHLAILIETMRREGYELQISRPEVIIKDVDGVKMEPYEEVFVEVPEKYSGAVIEQLNKRQGIMQTMESPDIDVITLVYKIPSRGLLGYRSQFITDTKGEGILYSIFDRYDKVATGDIKKRKSGSMISQVQGKAVAYAIFNLQERGSFFISPNDLVYEGMIVGINAKPVDIIVNPTKKKQLTNVRASGTDEALRLTPPIELTLEKAMEFIEQDELIEITPKSIRIRKKILDSTARRRAQR